MPANTGVFDEIQCEDVNISERDSYEDLDMEMIRNIWAEKIKMGGSLPTFPITPSCHNIDNDKE
jgi:hypothetical protein